jgi:hypothetical protein
MRWQEDHKQLNPKRFVFIDETWAILRQAQDQPGVHPSGAAKVFMPKCRMAVGRGCQSTTAAFTGWLLKSEAIPRGSDD